VVIGHFAPAFLAAAAGERAPRLATTFVAAQLVDWGFFSLALIGVERMRIDPGASAMVPFDLYHVPYTHSLAGTAGWAFAFFLVVSVWQRNLVAGGLGAVVVVSHWALDWIVHPPDLTLAGSGTRYGLGLWDRPAIAIPLEIGITIAAFLFYLGRTRGPAGPPLVLLALMLVFQAINWFGPQPAVAGPLYYLQALAAFAVLTLAAGWVAENRRILKKGGLAARSP
jgi:hypothetical protein